MDPNFDLARDWKERVCPECGYCGVRHSSMVIIGVDTGRAHPRLVCLDADLCGVCAYHYVELSKVEW
jgi:hypothetical protein